MPALHVFLSDLASAHADGLHTVAWPCFVGWGLHYRIWLVRGGRA